jgi:hypothetical protein
VDLNDELLCAYLDGELDPDSRAQVDNALIADAGARLRLARMANADLALAAALPLPAADYFQAAMTARIQGSVTAVPWRRTVLPWAAAAAITGLFVGYLLPRAGFDAAAGTHIARLGRELAQVLESGSSGSDVAHGPAVVLTFTAADSRYCRVFRGDAQRATGEGLACRDHGEWALVAWDAAAGGSPQGFRTAGASALIDAAMDALGGQPAMSADEESGAMAAGWRAR